jgi:diguanylate cyclase (GGDEF)-like protein
MAERVAERIRRAVAEFVFLEDEHPTRVTVSAGVATYPTTDGVDSVDALVRAADVALYRAKDLGRDRTVSATSAGGNTRTTGAVLRADSPKEP